MIFPKSRFYFNIKFFKVINVFFSTALLKNKKQININIEKELINFFSESKFYFFSYGRSSYFYLLKNLRKQTKKK